MNDELKEILDDLRTYKDRYEYCLFNNLSFSNRDYKSKILLDYINNLQQDNTMYAQLKDEYEEEIKDLQQEIKEANESVEWWANRFKAVEKENERLKEQLLDILKGDSNG